MATRTMYCYCFVVLCVILCCGPVLGDTSNLKFRVRNSLKMEATDVDKYITTDGLSQCMMLCKLETHFQCEAASWGQGTCLLSKTVLIHHETYNQVMEENVKWTTMCRVVHPVFLAEGGLGRYTLNFNQAKSRCIDLGSRIASRQALLDSRSLGFEICSCGWLSDGTMGIVLQAPDAECWYLYSDGIIGGCISNYALADVYCEA